MHGVTNREDRTQDPEVVGVVALAEEEEEDAAVAAAMIPLTMLHHHTHLDQRKRAGVQTHDRQQGRQVGPNRKAGDRASGLVQRPELLLVTWLEEATRHELNHQDKIHGLVGLVVVVLPTNPIQEVGGLGVGMTMLVPLPARLDQAPVPPARGMRVQDSGEHQDDKLMSTESHRTTYTLARFLKIYDSLLQTSRARPDTNSRGPVVMEEAKTTAVELHIL